MEDDEGRADLEETDNYMELEPEGASGRILS